MITLYTFGPYFGLPDPSPFVMKGDMLLKLSGLKYETSTKGFQSAPKGKLPYIRDGETVVADSTLIRLYLEQKHGIDFDRALGPRERGIGWVAEKMLEDHLYWIMIYWRWLTEPNFTRGPKNFFKRAPAIIRPLAERFVLRNIRRNLHGHGIGRHSEAETTAMAARGIEALAQILDDNRYFLGAAPSGADATAFAFIAGALSPHFESPVRDKMQSMDNLVAYRDRMMREFYPEFAK
ncbi:MAG TPA: glutathione S-transferase family protein [Steroidobacteraceae bacterium]|jgi:glutathione S-transferase|nr:glutathione S-transferase family protein [Steroidobacteraceae bacterium]